MAREDIDRVIDRLEVIFREAPVEITDKVIRFGRATTKDILSELLSKVEISGGRFGDFSTNETALMNAFTKLDKSISGRDYSNIISSYLLNVDDITANQIKFAKVAKHEDVAKMLKRPSPEQISLIDKTLFDFKQVGIKLYFIDPVKKELFRAIQLGASIEDTRERLFSIFADDKILQRWAGQTANDGLRALSGQINNEIGQEFGFEKYIYVGGLVEDSRPLCREIVKTYNGELTPKELNKVLSKHRGAAYLYPNTNAGNFAVNRGGYGCLHSCYLV